MTTIGRRPPYTALAQPRPRRTAPRVRQLQGLGGVSRATTALATATSGPSRPGQVVHARRPAVRELRPCEPEELGHEQVLGDRAAVRLRVNDDRLPAPGVASRQRSGVSRREPARLVRRQAETERRGSLLGRIDVYERGVQRAGSAGAPWRRCHSRGSWRRLRPSTREARCGLRPAACNSKKRV